MSTSKNGAVLRQIRTLWSLGSFRDLTDGQLLERFATDPGEAAELAFAGLVERHGPMVLRVCRSILAEPHDAQDAFQATFLVLIRKARGLWVRDSIGPWLHQVAYRTASCARAETARRRRLERRAAEVKPASSSAVGDDLGRMLHEEVARLPDRFREPVILCDLEGRTHEQAARALGWPVGTVKSRLSRGRDRLRDKLARRGVAPGLGLLVADAMAGGLEAAISQSLVKSSTEVAFRFIASRPVAGSVTSISLAQEVLKSMLIHQWFKAASALLAIGVVGSGVGRFVLEEAKAEVAAETRHAAPADDGQAIAVKLGKLVVSMNGRGKVESSVGLNVLCEVEGTSTILSLVPEGTYVKKGNIVGQLDSAPLRERLIEQRDNTRQAESTLEQARGALAVAEMAKNEYVEGTARQEQETLSGAISAAETAVARAEARIGWIRQARKHLDETMTANVAKTTPAEIVAALAAEDRLEAAEKHLASERTTLRIARIKPDQHKFTMARVIGELQNDIDWRKSQESIRGAARDLEKFKEAKLESQFRACTLTAPGDGCVFYANPSSGRMVIEEEAVVRQRQLLFRVIDLNGPMRINTKMPESIVDQIKTGMPAQIKVGAMPDKTLTGIVKSVAPMADTTRQGDRKFYTTYVEVNGGPVGLRPGMAAEVEILQEGRDGVPSVPISALHRNFQDTKDLVLVKKPDGTFEEREVSLGLSDGHSIEILRGLQPGELVVPGRTPAPSTTKPPG